MSYCLNPLCSNPTDSHNRTAEICASCGFQLLLQGRFRALKPIGQGGFGRTFLAVDEQQLGKPRCVIKQSMPDQLTHREHAAALFHQEAMRLAELGQHPQIPELIAHCDQENYQYLVQEFIDGQTLAQALAERGQFTPAEIDQILHSLLPVLDFIHSHEVIHRDIKPDNIIRRAGGQLVLVDFGAAKHATGTALLKTGTSIGSAEFIAPEQARGKATYASDLYSLGVTCVHLLTQMSPFDLIDGDNQWVWQDWLNGKITPELRHCLNRMIMPAPNRRFQSAKDVQEFLANPKLPETATPKPATVPPVTVRPSAIKPVPAGRSRNLRQPLTITAITAFTIGAIAAAITLPQFAAEANRAKEAEAKTYVASMGRAQQAYFLENNQFATELQPLGLGIKSETENYSYKVVSQLQTPGGQPAVQTAAILKKGDLKSYTGIVWVVQVPVGSEAFPGQQELTTMAIVCESQRPTVQSPPEPVFEQATGFALQANCPAGYASINR